MKTKGKWATAISVAVGITALLTWTWNVYGGFFTEAEAQAMKEEMRQEQKAFHDVQMQAAQYEIAQRKKADIEITLERLRDKISFLNSLATRTVDQQEELEWCRERVGKLQADLDELQ